VREQQKGKQRTKWLRGNSRDLSELYNPISRSSSSSSQFSITTGLSESVCCLSFMPRLHLPNCLKCNVTAGDVESDAVL
jgi:hypothetical protein